MRGEACIDRSEMKEKMAQKIGEKGPKMATPEVKAEKNDSSKDAHQR